MLIALFFANADVNSRIASSCPFYFWTVAAIFAEKKGFSYIAAFGRLHNLAYMLLNFVLFIMEVGFF
jgi:hypothetical protein